ncbi:MAG: haloacid dehalogenase-like hydrolase [Gemmataceae bacterium]
MIVCLFDIDGTLLASGGAGKAALESALVEEFHIPLRVHIPYSGRTDRAIIRDLFRAHDIPETPENLDRIFQGYFRRLPESLRKHQGRVLPGVMELLGALKARDHVAIGLLTGNVQAGARVKLGHFGLFEHFRFGGFGDNHFDRDDVAREAFAVACERCGPKVCADRIWVIGDTPLDVQCARAIGAKVAAVATGVHTVSQLAESKPDLLFEDLGNHALLLERIG